METQVSKVLAIPNFSLPPRATPTPTDKLYSPYPSFEFVQDLVRVLSNHYHSHLGGNLFPCEMDLRIREDDKGQESLKLFGVVPVGGFGEPVFELFFAE